MKAVALHLGAADFARQRNQSREDRLAPVKAGIEAGNLWHAGQPFPNSFNCRQIIRLMQRRQWHQTVKIRKHLRGNDRRASEFFAPMHDAVSYTQHSTRPVPGFEPRRESIQRVAAIVHLSVGFLTDQDLAVGVLCGYPRRSADALDLAARFEAPIFRLRSSEDTELEAR